MPLISVVLPFFTVNSVGLKGSLLLLFFKILICAVLLPKNPGSVKYLLFKELKIGLNEEEYNLIIDQNNLVLRLVLRDLGRLDSCEGSEDGLLVVIEALARPLISPLLGSGVLSAEFNNEAIFSQAFGWVTFANDFIFLKF